MLFKNPASLLVLLFLYLNASCSQDTEQGAVSFNKENSELARSLSRMKSAEKESPDTLLQAANQVLLQATRLQDRPAIVRSEAALATAYWKLGNHSKSMEAAMHGLRHAERWKTDSLIPDLYATIGQLHKEKRNYDMAFEAVKKGLQISEQLADTTSILLLRRMQAMFTQGVGANAKDTAIIHRSLNMHLQALKMAEASPRFERARIGYYNNIAQVYVKRRYLDSADYYVQKAIILAKKYDQPFSLTYSYTWLAQIFEARGNLEQNVRYLNDALLLCRKLKNPYREMEVCSYITASYRKAGKYKEALDYYDRYSDLRDSLKVLQNIRQISELELKYDTEKKDQQIAALSQTNTLRARQTMGALVAIVLISAFAVVTSRQYQRIREQNQVLAENNIRINEQSERMQFLMKELHHRVKNNLQIVSNLLSIQGNRLQDDTARNIIKAGQQRIEAMSIIHRSLYGQDSNNMVNMPGYIANLSESILNSFGSREMDVQFQLDITVTELDVDVAIPLGLIANEWITNSFKHAFKTVESPRIWISLIHTENGIRLEISDNGPGFKREKWESPNGSFGMKLIRVLSKQLEGRARIPDGAGARLQLDISWDRLNLTS